jgi:hypothetical protein
MIPERLRAWAQGIVATPDRSEAGVVGGTRVAPERVRLLLDHLAAGVSPGWAARLAGVSHGFARASHHKVGGVYRPADTTCCERYLSGEGRYELARLGDSGLPVRAVARRVGRSAPAIGRELARSACRG